MLKIKYKILYIFYTVLDIIIQSVVRIYYVPIPQKLGITKYNFYFNLCVRWKFYLCNLHTLHVWLTANVLYVRCKYV